MATILLVSPVIASADTLADMRAKLAELSLSLNKIITSLSSLSSSQQAQVVGSSTTLSQTFTTVGPVSFTVPADFYWFKVTMAGGGGGGSGANNGGTWGVGGGGGGGYSQQIISVIPGQVINGFVGAGGAAGGYSSSGTSGQNTTFGSLTATGGAGGAYGSWVPGAGGTPGGQSGGSTAAGTGGASGAGQGLGTGAGTAGKLYGGGGGGGNESSSPAPGAGAQGWIKLEWDITPAPTMTLTANPTSVTSGQSTQLSWSSTNTTSCTSSGDGASWGWPSTRYTNGAQYTPALTTIQTYTMSCTGAGGAVSKSVTVPVAATIPTITTTSPAGASVLAKRNTELKWTWSSSGSIPTVDIWLVTPAGQPLNFAKAYPNNGSFWWAVGFANTEWNQNIPNDNYTIAVCPSGVGIDLHCGKFNVTIYGDTPVIGIVYPTGGETFQIGGPITVSFSGVKGGEQYRVDLLKQAIMTPDYPLGTIVGISADLSKNTFTIPSNVPAGTYTAQVIQLTNQGTCVNACAIAESKPFSISLTTPAPTVVTTPTITVLSPNGELYQAGTPLVVQWSQNYEPASITLKIINAITGTEYYQRSLTTYLGKNFETISPEGTNIPAGKYIVLVCDNTKYISVNFAKPVCGSGLFTITAPSIPPTITSISPASATLGFSAPVTIRGTNLSAVARLNFYLPGSGVPLGSLQLTSVSPDGTLVTTNIDGKFSGNVLSLRNYEIALATADPGAIITNRLGFTIVNQAPTPTPTPNPTVDALQAQINSLMQQIALLQKQAGNQGTSPSTSTTPGLVSGQTPPADIDPSQGSSCTQLSYNMKLGSRDSWTNGEVTKLQGVLILNGYLNAEATGYFGYLTLRAVQAFQTASGFDSTGFVGPLTRAKVGAITCSRG